MEERGDRRCLPLLQKSGLLASLARINSLFVASRFAGLTSFKPMRRLCVSCRNQYFEHNVIRLRVDTRWGSLWYLFFSNQLLTKLDAFSVLV